MSKRLVPLLVALALLVVALPAVGCGGDDNGSGGGDTPSLNDAKKKAKEIQDNVGGNCVEEARKIAGSSEAEAKKLCAGPSDAEVKKRVRALGKSCLKLANTLPEGDVRDKAVQDCKDSVK